MLHINALTAVTFSFLPLLAIAQFSPPVAVQNNTFNSTYGPYNPDEVLSLVTSSNLPASVVPDVLIAVDFERSNWAGNSARLDPFYTTLPPATNANTSSGSGVSYKEAGIPLKVQNKVETTLYTLPPGVALSRLLYTTRNQNGTILPASAYVLWPWSVSSNFKSSSKSKKRSSFPIVAWGHGTSGWSAECGPSHIRNLWYQFGAPFTLALQGYVVVAPDYAGLGVEKNIDGEFIPHQYASVDAAGSDLLYAVRAARKAWKAELGSSSFVVMGHSQGGGAAWGAAKLLATPSSKMMAAEDLSDGYLGAIAGSPAVNYSPLMLSGAAPDTQTSPVITFLLTAIGFGMPSIFPSFRLSYWLTAKGVARANLLQRLQGCLSTAIQLYSTDETDLLRPDWKNSTDEQGRGVAWYLAAFLNATTITGREKIKGPLLVLQGTVDPTVPEALVSATVNASCAVAAAARDTTIDYVRFKDVSHTPVMYVAQQVWLDWLADRFAGVEARKGCRYENLEPVLTSSAGEEGGPGAYQKEIGYYFQWPAYSYFGA